MTHQAPTDSAQRTADPGGQIARLRHVLALVEEIGGGPRQKPRPESALEENATISSAYADAPAIVQRRFDAMATETALWAAAGVKALLAVRAPAPPPRAAAAVLAAELARSMRQLHRMIGRGGRV